MLPKLLLPSSRALVSFTMVNYASILKIFCGNFQIYVFIGTKIGLSAQLRRLRNFWFKLELTTVVRSLPYLFIRIDKLVYWFWTFVTFNTTLLIQFAIMWWVCRSNSSIGKPWMLVWIVWDACVRLGILRVAGGGSCGSSAAPFSHRYQISFRIYRRSEFIAHLTEYIILSLVDILWLQRSIALLNLKLFSFFRHCYLKITKI